MTLQLVARRALVVAGVVAALVVGGASIKVASAWTAAAAPLNDPPASLSSIQAALDQERARSAELETQLRTLEAASADLAAALDTAKGQVNADTATADELRASLAAAEAKLAQLQATLARASAARSVVTTGATVAGPAAEPGEGGEPGGDDD